MSPPAFIDDGEGQEWRRALAYPNSALRVLDYEPPAPDLSHAGAPADAAIPPVSAGIGDPSNDPSGDFTEGSCLSTPVLNSVHDTGDTHA